MLHTTLPAPEVRAFRETRSQDIVLLNLGDIHLETIKWNAFHFISPLPDLTTQRPLSLGWQWVLGGHLWGLTVTLSYKVDKCDPESLSQVSRQICPYREKQGMQVLQKKKERRRGGWQRRGE